jgi:hypothetical protein
VNSAHNIVSVLLSSDEWPPQFNLGPPQAFQVGSRPGLATSTGNDKLASTYVQVKYANSPYTNGQFEVVTVNLTETGKADITPQAEQIATDMVNLLDRRH